MSNRRWILGSPDPEMEAIAALLRECGEQVAHATNGEGERVRGGEAYRAVLPPELVGPVMRGEVEVYEVECAHTPAIPGAKRIDHHRAGDPGFGRPPSEFFPASSLGQVVSHLARLGKIEALGWPTHRYHGGCEWGAGRIDNDEGMWTVQVTDSHCPGAVDIPEIDPWDIQMQFDAAVIPRDLIVVAAADHCLGAAYRGECPGVYPDALLRHRAEQKARFQGRSVEDVLADIEAAIEELRDARPLWAVSIFERRRVVEVWEYDRVCNGRRPDPDTWYRRRDEALDAVDVPKELEDVRDLRSKTVAELPDAASREGLAYLATVSDRDGRTKVVIGGCTTPSMVRAFIEQWAPSQGLVDIYGDPERGFAGGYLPAGEVQS